MTKYNNVDVILSQRMTSIVPTNLVLYFSRINDEDGIEPTFLNMVRILRAFILSKELVEKSALPVQLIEALKEFMNKGEADVVQMDVENLISIFDYFNYPLKIVGRLDLNGSVVEETTDDQMTYLISPYYGNETGTSGFYSGYAKLYDIKRRPLAMDFMEYFNLSQSQLSSFDLDNAMKTYLTFKSEDRLNDFDDTLALEFMKARKLEFITERTV